MATIPSSKNKGEHRLAAERKATIGRDQYGNFEMKSVATVDVEESMTWEQALDHRPGARSQTIDEEEYVGGQEHGGIHVTRSVEQSSWLPPRKQSDPSTVESVHQQLSAPSVKEMY